MEKFIHDILIDIYKLDPSLRGKEDELIKLIRLLVASRPEAVIDSAFKAELRRQLLEKMASSPASAGVFTRLSRELVALRPAMSLASAVAVLIILIGTGIAAHDRLILRQDITPGTGKVASQEGISMRQVADNAFGTVTTPVQAPLAMSAKDVPAGRGGSEMGLMALTPRSSASRQQQFIAPYSFSGSLPDIGQKVPVLRHVKGNLSSGSLAALAQNMQTSLFRMNSFGKAVPEMITLTEDKDRGYMISFNFKEGYAAIERNLARWDAPYLKCETQQCIQSYRLQPSDMPSDGELIDVANAFLAEHGIDRGPYGTPVILGDWRKDYENAPSPQDAYIPDVITIAYPIVIDNKQTYDENGTPFGLQVSVSVRERKVAMVGNIQQQSYESSLYDSQADYTAIIETASRGGMRSEPSAADPSQVRTLSNPRMILVRTTRATADGFDEYLVPALAFSVGDTSSSAPSNVSDNDVIVPLVRNFFANSAEQ